MNERVSGRVNDDGCPVNGRLDQMSGPVIGPMDQRGPPPSPCQQLRLLKLLDVKLLRLALQEGLLGEGGQGGLHHDDGAVHALVLHALGVFLDGLDANLLLIRKEHEDLRRAKRKKGKIGRFVWREGRKKE